MILGKTEGGDEIDHEAKKKGGRILHEGQG